MNANLILSHHPVIFHPLKSLGPQDVPYQLASRGIAALCCHTNLDLSPVCGVNVALGTDGMSSHNSADLFSDIKLAAVLHNGVERDPMAVSAWAALEIATVNGARALGRDTGVIAPGKTADLILVDLSAPNLIPCHDPVEDLVFSAHGSNVEMNMARGQVIYEKGSFLTLDLERVRWEVEHYALPLIFG